MTDARPPEDESQSFGDLLTFNLAPPKGHIFHLSGKIFLNQQDGQILLQTFMFLGRFLWLQWSSSLTVAPMRFTFVGDSSWNVITACLIHNLFFLYQIFNKYILFIVALVKFYHHVALGGRPHEAKKRNGKVSCLSDSFLTHATILLDSLWWKWQLEYKIQLINCDYL